MPHEDDLPPRPPPRAVDPNIDNIPRVIFNDQHEAQQLQLAPQRPAVLHAHIEGLELRFLDNVFALHKAAFTIFLARNPHLQDNTIITAYAPQPANEVLFQIQV